MRNVNETNPKTVVHNKKNLKPINSKNLNKSLLEEYNIRVVESPNIKERMFNNFNKGTDVKMEISSNTFYNNNPTKTENEEEEAKFDVNSNKPDVSSQEFFMRRSQMNYIKKNLSPVKAITLKNNLKSNNSNNSYGQNLNGNYLSGSTSRVFSSKMNNHTNILKSDLILVMNLIQKNSNILNYYKMLLESELEIEKQKNQVEKDQLIKSNATFNQKSHLQNIFIQKKCLEIENELKENFSDFIEKINENCKNMDFLMNYYKCLVKDELIFKIAMENFLNQYLIKKVDDLIFLINLTNFNENNIFINSYTETHSKTEGIKSLIENIKKFVKEKQKEHREKPNINFANNVDKTYNNSINLEKVCNSKPKLASSKSLACCCKCDCHNCSDKETNQKIQCENKDFISFKSIKSIPEVNENNETFCNSKAVSRKNSNFTSKNSSLKIKPQNSIYEEKQSGLIKFDLIKMGSVSEEANETNDKLFIKPDQFADEEASDSNKILEMKTFSEFKSYETENNILNHIKKLHDNLNEKIFQIFYDFFKNASEKDINKKNLEFLKSKDHNSNTSLRASQSSLTKIRGMLLNKREDGILSFIFIREEFEKMMNEKENLIESILLLNKNMNENTTAFNEKMQRLEEGIEELKTHLNRKESELKLEFLKNLEEDNKNYLKMMNKKQELKITDIESENMKLKLEMSVFENKLKLIQREKEDYKIKLEYFTMSEERRVKKKKLKINESYEEILIEQFDSMKKGFTQELENLGKEIIKIQCDNKKVINKLEEEKSDLKYRNSIYYKQIEDIRFKLKI